MIADIETLQDTFKIGYETFEESRIEALKVLDMYHNRQYTKEQLATLALRGQPAETFNVIKLFARMLLGYYSTIVNNIKVSPTKEESVMTASVLQDTIDYVFRKNNFMSEGNKVKLDCILTGLMCTYTDVVDTDETDKYGRPIYDINIDHVPSLELVIDPMSKLDDYSDARYIHRFKWMSEDVVNKLFGKSKVAKLNAYDNHLNIDEADFSYAYNVEFQGKYKRFDNYLVVHSIIIDDNDKTWSIYWSGDTELSKEEVTYKEVKNPYRVQKLHTSNKTEFYGLFREIIETQNAINQALVKIQLMVNTQKAFVEEGAVDNLADFTNQFNRVNAIIPVKDLSGIKIESLSREVVDQYTVIDKALDRVQRILSINDSFLGMAYASDSGSKVKIQQNASIVAQRYATSKIEQFYRLLGWDIVNLIKQYFTANDIIRVSDTYQGNKFVELNRPLEIPTGQLDPQTGMPQQRMIFEEVLNPADNKPLEENGVKVMAPIPTMDTDLSFTKADIEIDSVNFNEDDEKNQAMLEQFINGPMGQMLSQVNPSGYFKAGSLSVKNIKSKYSPQIADILEQTANMLQPQQQQAMQQGQLDGQMSGAQAQNQMIGR